MTDVSLVLGTNCRPVLVDLGVWAWVFAVGVQGVNTAWGHTVQSFCIWSSEMGRHCNYWSTSENVLKIWYGKGVQQLNVELISCCRDFPRTFQERSSRHHFMKDMVYVQWNDSFWNNRGQSVWLTSYTENRMLVWYLVCLYRLVWQQDVEWMMLSELDRMWNLMLDVDSSQSVEKCLS